jgi:hypothetical protein
MVEMTEVRRKHSLRSLGQLEPMDNVPFYDAKVDHLLIAARRCATGSSSFVLAG